MDSDLAAAQASYEAALDTVRANPDDPDAVAAYKTARDEFDAARAAARVAEGRTGVSFGGDMIRSEG